MTETASRAIDNGDDEWKTKRMNQSPTSEIVLPLDRVIGEHVLDAIRFYGGNKRTAAKKPASVVRRCTERGGFMAIKRLRLEFDPFEVLGIKPPKDRELRDEALTVSLNLSSLLGSRICRRRKITRQVARGSGHCPRHKKIRTRIRRHGCKPELTGDMPDALEVVRKRGTKLSLQIEGDEAPKADGHNNHSGDSPLPERRFIPKEGGDVAGHNLAGRETDPPRIRGRMKPFVEIKPNEDRAAHCRRVVEDYLAAYAAACARSLSFWESTKFKANS